MGMDLKFMQDNQKEPQTAAVRRIAESFPVRDGFQMARVLVAGAGGYIGRTLLENGYEVRALDRYFLERSC